MSTRTFRWCLAALAVLAFTLRAAYFVGAEVVNPIVGDVVDYLSYAWNLVHHATFSSAHPGSATWPPDAYRGPGYPAFLALWMWLAGGGQEGYLLAVWAQVVVGALTAPLAAIWARQWLPGLPALATGAMVALWPHLIVFSSTLLGETVFAAALLLFLVATGVAANSGKPLPAILAGLAGGFATLVNPVATFISPLAALLLWCHRKRAPAAFLLSGFLLVSGGWSLRNSLHPDMAGSWERASINLVQGSWPLYHAAYNAQYREPQAAAVLRAIETEHQLLRSDPEAGLQTLLDRMRSSPARYLRWYLLEKPYALWGWWVSVGWGDVHFLATTRSPFENAPAFIALRAICRFINPALFLLALGAAAAAWTRREDAVSARVSRRVGAAVFAYLTLVHVVLQSEPRYGVAYRGIEFALAATGCLIAAQAIRRFAPRRRAPGMAEGS